MPGDRVFPRLATVAIAAVGLLLAGCTSGTSPVTMGMMGAPSAVTSRPSAPAEGTMGGGSGMGGAFGSTTTQPACAVPASLPGVPVTVMLVDTGMMQPMGSIAPLGGHMMLRASPASVPDGQVSLVASNMGRRTHELVVLPLADGASAGQRVPGVDGRVDETGSLGEVSGNCAEGAGEGIGPGAVGWTTLTLAPGRYELVCNLQNHYANGMYQIFVVT